MGMRSQISLLGLSVFLSQHRGPAQHRQHWFKRFMRRRKCLHPVVIQAMAPLILRGPIRLTSRLSYPRHVRKPDSGMRAWAALWFDWWHHSFTHSNEMFRGPNICKTRRKPEGYKPEWDIKLGFKELIFCSYGMVGKTWNLWAKRPLLEGCLFHLGAVWFQVMYRIFLSLSFLICKMGISTLNFKEDALK